MLFSLPTFKKESLLQHFKDHLVI